MDQVKIGQFIKAVRKEKNLTQREVAEQLLISEKTVSKWETGNGLPEVSLMKPLCDLLGISLNEFFSGERLDEKQYYIKAEANIMSLVEEKAKAKKNIVLSIIVVAMTLIAGIPLIMIASLIEMAVWLRITSIVIALVLLVCGITVAIALDLDAGAFECPHCGERFVPTATAYVFAMHGITWRRLRCPKCHKKGFCRKKLSRENEE